MKLYDIEDYEKLNNEIEEDMIPYYTCSNNKTCKDEATYIKDKTCICITCNIRKKEDV